MYEEDEKLDNDDDLEDIQEEPVEEESEDSDTFDGSGMHAQGR